MLSPLLKHCWTSRLPGGVLAVAMALSGCAPQAEPIAQVQVPAPVEFNAHVRPIFVQNCTACHGGVKKAGGVSFIYKEEVMALGESGRRVVTPGSPEESELFRRITSTHELERMPPVAHADALSAGDIAIIRQWINDGAPWEEHWAYRDPVQIDPAIGEADKTWAQSKIDEYVLAEMLEYGLIPNPEQDRGRLLRRLSLDLIGLPPSWAEVEAFVADESPDAYERRVDQLLARPEFGERWAVPWLDLARYADTKGFERDPARDVWPWRDWVIRALNEDLPFDAFTRRQLAGDLQSNPSLDDLVATGFHRNTKTNVEGGSDDEEFRVAAVIDRVNTTWQAWMGTTFGCVQCHSHPYDPLPHKSYYSFMALFDNDWDHDMNSEYPTIGYAVDPTRRDEAFELQQRIDQLGRDYQQLMRDLVDDVPWQDATYQAATSTRGVTFAIARDEAGRELLQTGPNVPKDVVHRVTLHPGVSRLGAMRIDALMAPDASVAFPGPPFVVSHVELSVVPPEGESVPVVLERVVPDEYGHSDWPELSLDPSTANGWGAYPKQHYPRWAVFIPQTPVEVPEGAAVRLVIHNRRGHDGAAQPVLRRFQISFSDDARWATASADLRMVGMAAARESALQLLREIELADQPVLRQRNPQYSRVTNIFIRGDWQTRGERVEPGVPPILRPSAGGPIDSRSALVDWLMSDENPLTARFTVNRHWEQLFGRGLMETLEDFGSASPPPSHPELLDYLALQFRGEWGWSVKRLLREMVLTSTYRQSAITAAPAAEIDPQNIWLSRGPRSRLTAEMVRDNALQVSGLLSDKRYGPPVMPPQPEGVWRSPYNDEQWATSEGADRYRRAIYTFWKRTVPYPSMLTFDAPSRDVCNPRRISTNTPLQALVMLNDPVYWECAEQLARRARRAGGNQLSKQIEYAFREALLREPSAAELEDLMQLYDDLVTEAGGAPASTVVADSRVSAPLQLTMNAILNLDDFLTK